MNKIANKKKIKRLLQDAVKRNDIKSWNQLIELNNALDKKDRLGLGELEKLVEKLGENWSREWNVYDGDEGLFLIHSFEKKEANRLAKYILKTYQKKWNGVYVDAEVYSMEGDFGKTDWWVEVRVDPDFQGRNR